VVLASARAHGLLLELAEPGRGLAGVEDARAGALDRAHVPGGERRDAREPAQEVQRHTLGREDRRGRPGDLSDGTLLTPLSLRAMRDEDELGIHVLKDTLRDAHARDHARLLLIDPRACLRPLRHHGARRQVALADILGERALDRLAHVAATGVRSMPAAA
jgi:hypothetical protein